MWILLLAVPVGLAAPWLLARIWYRRLVIRSLMAVLLSAMSFAWMRLFWRYRSLLAIIAMHVVVDLLMIGHLHFTWFERLRLA